MYRRRVVALVGHGDKVVLQAEREQHLRGGGNQAHDAQEENDMAQLLTEAEIEGRLREAQWMREGETIVREQQFADFAAALAFVNRVAAVAEERNHHPDILLHSWNKVRLSVSTHSAGGLTQADFDLAYAVDGLM